MLNSVISITQRRRKLFQGQMEQIARDGARMGQIYSLRQTICGDPKKVKQVPAALRDSQTGNFKYDAESIKKAVTDHVASTLADRPPLPRYEPLAQQRTAIISAAAGEEPEERVEFTLQELQQVIREMKIKKKYCNLPVVGMSLEMQKVLLRVTS